MVIKLDKKTIEKLIEKGNQETRNPVMVHGKCVEAIEIMLSTGYLPSSYSFGRSKHPGDNGYLFFHPRKSAFQNHSLYEVLYTDEWGTNEIEIQSSYYAMSKQWHETMKRKCVGLGYEWDLDFSAVGFMDDIDVIDFGPPLEDSFAYYLETLPETEIKKIKDELWCQKGVMLGINSDVFELKIEQGVDEPHHEVRIYLPEGLNIKYVDYIKPLGDYEQGKLSDFCL